MRKYYLLETILFLFVSIAFTSNLKAQYCLPTYSQYCAPPPAQQDYIDSFYTTGGIANITNNGTGCDGLAPNNYINHPSMYVSQLQGQSFNVNMKCASVFGWAQGFRIWIDYNNDIDFSDPGEDVYASPGSGFTWFNGTVTIPPGTPPGVKRMRVLCRWATVPAITDYCGAHSYGECEDYNVNVISSVACTGVPTAGAAVVNIVNPCPGTLISVGLTGTTLSAGLAYQWLSASGCAGVWSPISGLVNPTALTPTLSVTTVPGLTLGYRCRVTCTTTGLSDTSTLVCVLTQPWSCTSPCFGISAPATATNQEILNVTLGTSSLNNTTTCASPLIGSQGNAVGLANAYANFTGTGGVASPVIYKGLATPFSLLAGNCTGTGTAAAKVYIDFNHNTVFTDPGEQVFSNPSIPTTSPSFLVTGTITAPASALTGCTRMRVILNSATLITPTGLYPFGETEDYSVNIILPGAYDPSITAMTAPIANNCPGATETLTATICNYGALPINLSLTNPAYVSYKINGPSGLVTLIDTITTGTIAALGGGCITSSKVANLFTGGIYLINSSISIPGVSNSDPINDSLGTALTVYNNRPYAGNDTICQYSPTLFGQGMTVGGCSSPILANLNLTFNVTSCIDNVGSTSSGISIGLPANCADQFACSFANTVIPALPAGAAFVNSATLTITNMNASTPGTTANQVRMNLYGALPTGPTLYAGGVVGIGAPVGASANFTYTRQVSTTELSAIFNPANVGTVLNIGYWETNNNNATIADAFLNSGSVITMNISYQYVPPSFAWFDVPTGGTSLYSLSPFDPMLYPNAVVNNSNVPGSYTFYAACLGLTNCRIPVDLVIHPTPIALQDTMSACESPISSNSAQFCLDLLVPNITAGASGVVTTFYGDQSLFLPIIPTCFHTSSSNYIYSKVTIPSTGCYSSDSVYLEVIPTPQFLANPLVGNACAPACIDVASLINPFTPASGSDTLYYEDAACTMPHPNPHCVYNVDTVYVVLKTNTIPYCSDTTTAYIDIIPALNYIVNQDTLLNFSICGSVGCNNITLGDGNTETAFTSTDCRKVASVKDLSNGISLGSTSICEEIDCAVQFHNGQPYVNRNYQITPAVNDSAEVCLYYLAQDFADFEAAALGSSWPSPFMDPYSTLCITQIDNGNMYSPGHTALSIPNAAITSTFDIATQVWKVCFKVDSFSYFYCSTCNPLNIPLPITLSNFTGKRVNAISELKWSTSSEKNNSHFIVQRGKDAKVFSSLSSKINSKAVNGNSNSLLNYSYEDLSPFNGHNYYRLQQVDIDGNASFSEVLDIYFGDETMVSLYPNPVNSVLNFEINTPKSTTVITKIMDATGRVVKTIEMYLQAGNNLNQVDMKSLADGIYMISITNNKGLNYTQTVRKN